MKQKSLPFLLLLLFQAEMWLLSVGFVLAFGAMFSKTWRVHKVTAFTSAKRIVSCHQRIVVDR